MAKFDRRAFLRTAAASAAFRAPATLAIAGSLDLGLNRSARESSSERGDNAMNSKSFSPERPERMHDIMARSIDHGDMPGLVTVIARNGKVHIDTLGVLAVGSKVPMQSDTIFRISSMTKPITAAAAMILVEEGKLTLDSSVDHFLPELANRKVLKRLDGPLDDTVPANRSITLRDLLTFRMGFGQIMARPEAYPILKAANDLQIGMGAPNPAKMPRPDEWLRRLGTLPLMNQPGEKWLYNTGSDVAGVLIVRASGYPLETFLRERIFDPLGMKDTSFSVPSSKRERFATSYWTNFDTDAFEVYDSSENGQWNQPPAFPLGGSGLVSTANDYVAFSQMMLNKGTLGVRRILSAASIEMMTTDQLTPQQKSVSGLVDNYFDTHGWGFGVSVVTRPTGSTEPVGLYGWDGGLGTSWRVDPKANLFGILLTQRMWTSPSPPPICRDFWTSAYQVIDEPVS